MEEGATIDVVSSRCGRALQVLKLSLNLRLLVGIHIPHRPRRESFVC
jgi:hypothetical protein